MKNWKTTLFGVLTGFGYLVLQGLQQGLKPKDVLLGAGIAAMGLFAKDNNVTGGTVHQ
jgi:hypothetical protein